MTWREFIQRTVQAVRNLDDEATVRCVRRDSDNISISESVVPVVMVGIEGQSWIELRHIQANERPTP